MVTGTTSGATDWIVVGNGLAGAALSYELQKQGFSVLLLDPAGQNATRYSYGGIAYWSGSTDLMRLLCNEGIALHRQLSAELEADTGFRELDLLLTIAPDRDPQQVAKSYDQMAILPEILSPAAASKREPLLNSAAVSGALRLPHGQVSPEATVAAYNQAFLRLGGKLQFTSVTGLRQANQQVTGVTTAIATYSAAQVAICAGAMSRDLLRSVGISSPLYFTQAEIIETAPVALKLQALVMPAELQRFAMEAEAGTPEQEQWNQPHQEILPPILDAGVVQLSDRRLRIGQLSRVTSDLEPVVDAAASEQALRTGIGRILPALESLPGDWYRTQVAFSGDRLPLVGAMPGKPGLYLFSGFSNPFAILPPIARRFAATQAAGLESEQVLDAFAPSRSISAP
ncbi:MAG: FAD-binding oxidoreductase [Pegethrix bostrychoides GSE-TBD4-15B]|jgi:glycine/D-amino acid oxidase-like deaminating enzyme|uniref:FAD-binding oxidoreductase n=1 Tax=Pegethrix bostrychoides GSE-TBD4-15B TaxID=2839662 RepID=A0A951U895_9CYAN|nr:FAD-binding oxidoreductase [Pegethrix bostrychoides GSE-TBD4-15B]